MIAFLELWFAYHNLVDLLRLCADVPSSDEVMYSTGGLGCAFLPLVLTYRQNFRTPQHAVLTLASSDSSQTTEAVLACHYSY